MANTRKGYQKSKKKSRASKIFRDIGLAILFVLLVGGGVFGYFVMKMADVTASAKEELDRGEQSEKREEVVHPATNNISILFLGLDDRDGSLKGRTDAMLLATFNKEEGSVKVVSIPRDARVEIVGKDRFDKINHAHAFGGLDMTVATVENFLDIPVDYFVKLNFDAFIEIIDAFGGIEIDSPIAFTEMNSKDQHDAINIIEGRQLLNGEEALAYARMRKKDPRGDIGRGERQQQVVEAIIKKSVSLQSISKFDDVLKSLEDNLSTNLSFGNILSLHSYGTNLNSVESLSFEGENATIKGVYYYELKPESVNAISTTLKEHLQLK